VQRIIDGLDSKSPWLKDVTQLLLTNGLYKLAITCQKKIDMKLALDTCVNLSMWEEASYLADEGGLRSDLEQIVKGKTRELLKQDEHLRALELCQCVDLASDAAEILCRLAESKKGNIPPAIAKKLFILAAKQVERHREKAIDMSQLTKPRGGKATSDIASSIGKFMDDNCKDESAKNRMKVFSNAWRSAAAYHYFLLANKELYTGKIEIAMKAAIRCCEFIDILNSVQVYSLIALTSYMSKYFEVCSMSLTKLLTLDNIDKTSILLIQKLVRH
jgi:WD repeat-containing protein 35